MNPNSSFDSDRLSLEEVQTRQREQRELTSSLNETKARMRDHINADGDTEITKTHEELSKENEQLKRICAILNSRLKDTISELEEANGTIDGLRSGSSPSRGGMHRSDPNIQGASKDLKPSQAEIEELAASNDRLFFRSIQAKSRLSIISQPGFTVDYNTKLEDWVDPVDFDLDQWMMRNDILSQLAICFEKGSVVRNIMGYDFPSHWAEASYKADPIAKTIIRDRSIQAVQALYDDLKERRALSTQSEEDKPKDFKWQVDCERRDDGKGSIVSIWGNPFTSYQQSLGRIDLDDPIIADESVVKELKKRGYDERGWEPVQSFISRLSSVFTAH